MADRRAGFKFHGMTTEELRRRREENQVEIRKAKREDSLNKRRNLVTATSSVSSPLPTEFAIEDQKLLAMAQGLYSDDLDLRYKSIKDFRKQLSRPDDPPIDQVLSCGILPRVVEMLSGQDVPDNGQPGIKEMREALQFEAAWVLTNIASGTSAHTRIVVESGAFPLFVQLLSHENAELRGQCIWAIGNISGESPEYRDATLQHDVLSPLLMTLASELASNFSNGDLAKNTAWAVSNLCRGKPQPDWNQIAPALPLLAQLLLSVEAGGSGEEEVLSEACWAIAYMSDGSARALEDILATGVVPRLVRLLSSRSVLIQAAAVRALGNIVTGDDTQTQVVIDAGALAGFARLFSSTSRSILRETCWAISNITAGTPEQIRAVIEANLVPPILRLLSSDYFSVKREACWAICNATSVHQSHPDIVKYLVNQGCIKPLCDILAAKDVRIVQVALDGLDNILEVGQQEAMNTDDHMNPYALNVEEAQGLDTIYNLQQHANMNVYLKAKSIIDKYFGQEDEDLEETFATQEAFQFNPADSGVPHGGFDFSTS